MQESYNKLEWCRQAATVLTLCCWYSSLCSFSRRIFAQYFISFLTVLFLMVAIAMFFNDHPSVGFTVLKHDFTLHYYTMVNLCKGWSASSLLQSRSERGAAATLQLCLFSFAEPENRKLASGMDWNWKPFTVKELATVSDRDEHCDTGYRNTSLRVLSLQLDEVQHIVEGSGLNIYNLYGPCAGGVREKVRWASGVWAEFTMCCTLANLGLEM